MADKLDLVGLAEIAVLLDVHPVTVGKWRAKGVLPEPDAYLPKRPLWLRETIVAWAKETGRQVA